MRIASGVMMVIAVLTRLAGAEVTGQTDVFLARGGTPASVLVLPKQPHADEQLAAQELQDHIEKMSGAKVPMVTGKASAGLTPIMIGLASAPEARSAIEAVSTDPAAFRLAVTPNGIRVAGLSPEGTLFAAYELLELLGVRWYMPGDVGTVVPKRATVALRPIEKVCAPSFPARHLQTVYQGLPWYRRQRLGGPCFPGSHGIPLLPRADFQAEPDIFALVNGKRARSQLCVSNQEVIMRATAGVINYFDKHPDSPWIGMGPNDGGGFCQCEHCQAQDSGEWDPYAAEPSMTDRYVWFFNQVLKEVHKKYPKKKIGFYAYHTYKLPPRRWTPDPHIVPALAPITLCRIHGLSNPNCPDRSFYRTLMTGWGELLPEVYERGYYSNLACPSLPFSKVHAIRDETRVAYEAGIKGWRVECMPAWVNDTPTLYVAARLMWDVNTNVDGLLADFYNGFFGPASKPMAEYLTMIDHAFRDTDCHSGGSFCMPVVFTSERMRQGRKLLDAAAESVGDDRDDAFAQRVRLYRMNFDRLEGFLKMLDARNRFDFVTAKAALDHLRNLTRTMIDFRLYPNPPCDAPVEAYNSSLDRQARALWWRSSRSYIERFWAPTTESGYDRTAVRGELVAGCDDQWDFLIDTRDIGESTGWFRDGPIGGNWQPMSTKTASWSDQGLHYYKGIAWYRTQVTIPASFKGRKMYLWFGGIDEAAKVWLNGTLIGTSAEPGHGLPGMAGTFKPFDLDVTAAVRFGEPNTLAVKITNCELNEIGTGGIVAPVMFWAEATSDGK